MMSRLALALVLVLAACALLPGGLEAGNPRAIQDAYLIAHGMAESYQERPDADPRVAAQLARLDAQARAEIGSLRAGGGDAEAARAVSALTDYAAAQGGIPR